MGPILFKTLLGKESESFLTNKILQPHIVNVLKVVPNSFKKRFNSGSNSFRPNVKFVSFNKAEQICKENFEKRVKDIISKIN